MGWQDGWQGPGAAASAPTAPTITVSITGTTATVTVDGDAGMVHKVLYQVLGAAAWTEGGQRTGDGDVTIAGLAEGTRYVFVCQSYNGAVPSVVSSPVYYTLALTVSSAQRDMALAGARIQVQTFGENITYCPNGGETRSILGVVDRGDAEGLPGAPHGNAPTSEIEVVNHSDDGISSSEFDKNLDKIKYEMRIGETAQQRKIIEVLNIDLGMVKFKVA